MSSSQNYTSAFLVFVGDLGFLRKIAKDYKRDAARIKEGTGFSSCSYSFHLLATTSTELFLKLLAGYEICEKHKTDSTILVEDIQNEISLELKKFSHSLDRLFKNFPKLLQFLNIKKVYELQGPFAHEYRVELNNGDELALKALEGLRYGVFARKSDMFISCVRDEILIDLLNKIEGYVDIEEKRISGVLKKAFK